MAYLWVSYLIQIWLHISKEISSIEPFTYGLHSLGIAGGGKVDYWVTSKRFSF